MKIGILTHYYRSENYGGNLQAYALCKVLKHIGYQAQQISLNRSKTKNLKCRVAEKISYLRNYHGPAFSRKMKHRKSAFREFNDQMIPHSKVYTEKNIYTCVNQYDAFITGSDQVWHPLACCDAYLLKFVPSEKIKISYAASVATDILSPECRGRYRNAFLDYRAISVREQETVELLQDISPVPVEWTLDPTLLLTKAQWEEIATPYIPTEKYIFCYFLGDDAQQRKIATDFAQKRGLKIVTLPHLLGKHRKCDVDFGDEKLYDVSPKMLLALIREAECVFTDSFHATVFSLIYEKQHFVFQRAGAKSMGVRLQTLTNLFGTQDYFCNESAKQSLEYVEALPTIDYKREFIELEHARAVSIRFLKENLKRK